MNIGFDAKRAYQNYTGLGNYSRDLLHGLFKQHPEHSYHLYAPRLVKNLNLSFLNQYKNVHPKSPESPMDKTFKGLWRSINLEKALQKDGIDLFHGLSNEIPRRKKNSTIKYMVTIHDLIFKRFPRNYRKIDRSVYNTKFKYACNNADKIIAISEQTKRDIIDFYKIDDSKIEVIYQTCHSNFKKTYSDEIKDHVKTKYNLPNDFLLHVGTIETRKNLNALLQAIPSMKNDLPIVVVGRKTRYYNFLKVQMQKINVDPDRFLFLKNVSIEELPAIYQMANLFVYPSLFEGFGIPIIEALHSGTPVITSTGSCFAEAGGPNSLYTDPNDHESLGQKIDDLLQDSVLQGNMSSMGQDYVKKFQSENLIHQLHKVYEQLT